MAAEDKASTQSGPPQFSKVDQARAREWFKKATDLREKRDYDYAIESYTQGLGYWPEAVEEGHMPLWSLANQRRQAGGKKPGMMDGMRHPMTGKDAVKAMLNAEKLLAQDPTNAKYAEGVLKNAAKGRYLQTLRWIAPIMSDLLKRDKKPSKAQFKAFRDTLIESSGQAAEWGDSATETFLLQQAVESLEFLISRMPTDSELKDEQRDLAGKLTIARGKYDGAEDFRESLQDAEKQKHLHDVGRAKQTDESLDKLIQSVRADYEAHPDQGVKLTALVDLLCKAEQKPPEDEAIDLLTQQYEKTRNYNYKSRADDIRLRQLTRIARALMDKARRSGTDDDKQQARLAALEQREVALNVYRERVDHYPTDLRLKYRLGTALFDAGRYDEAIPMLQEAQNEPRSRTQSLFMIGRAFFEKGSHGQAIAVLSEALDKYEFQDEHAKQLMYWLGRAYEAAGQKEPAKESYGRLLRQDYNYMHGDARKRLEAL